MNNTESDTNSEDELLDEMDILNWSELVLETIFELDKKYVRYLKQKDVISIQESEQDRNKSKEAYLYLVETNEALIDASLYENFISMYEFREDNQLETILKTEQRISYFATIVAKHAQPVVSTVGKQSFESLLSHFDQQIEKQDIEPSLDEQYGFWFKENSHALNSRIITFSDIMNIEKELYSKLLDKSFTVQELESLLSSVEVEVLSKMVAEKKLKAIISNDKILFTVSKENKDKEVSSSLLLSPDEMR